MQEGLSVGHPAGWDYITLPQQSILCHVSHAVRMSAAACQAHVICASVLTDTAVSQAKTDSSIICASSVCAPAQCANPLILLARFSEWCTMLQHMTCALALLAIQLLREEAVPFNARELGISNAISAVLTCQSCKHFCNAGSGSMQ
jgi:hypothetical protein